MHVTHLFLLGMLPLAVGERAARQDALEAAEDDISKEGKKFSGADSWGGPSCTSCEGCPMSDATKKNLNNALANRAYGSSFPADDELLEATEKHDMMKFCALLHHSDELNNVPVQDHRRDAGKTSLPKKPNLASRSSLDCYPCVGSTPLLAAAGKGYVEMVKELLAARAPVDVADSFGRTPLLLAAEKGKTTVIQPLLNAGASVNEQDREGMTVLHYCKSIGLGLTDAVLRKNPKLFLKTKGSNGKTAEEFAKELRNQESGWDKCAAVIRLKRKEYEKAAKKR